MMTAVGQSSRDLLFDGAEWICEGVVVVRMTDAVRGRVEGTVE